MCNTAKTSEQKDELLFYIISCFAYLLIVLSVIYFGFSLYRFSRAGMYWTFPLIYPTLCEYSGLYKFTFIVVAVYITFKQLKASQDANIKTLNQLKLTQEDIVNRRETERTDATLLQCKYYLTEIQSTIEGLSTLGALTLLPINYPYKSVSGDYLKTDSSLSKQVHKNIDSYKKEILLALHKLEAFSALFNHGNMNLNLGKQIIGSTFIGQIELLLPLVAAFRQDDNHPFCKNLLELRETWLATISSDDTNP